MRMYQVSRPVSARKISLHVRAADGEALNNVVMKRPSQVSIRKVQPSPVPAQGLSRKEQLEREARMLLEKEDSWWKSGTIPPNVTAAQCPQHFKSLVLDAPAHSIVIAYFFSPQCIACRALWPKLMQIAGNNTDSRFIKLNTAERPLTELAMGLGVAKLPWFVIYSAQTGEELASFTANLSSISRLRAEIAAAKECLAPEYTKQW